MILVCLFMLVLMDMTVLLVFCLIADFVPGVGVVFAGVVLIAVTFVGLAIFADVNVGVFVMPVVILVRLIAFDVSKEFGMFVLMTFFGAVVGVVFVCGTTFVDMIFVVPIDVFIVVDDVVVGITVTLVDVGVVVDGAFDGVAIGVFMLIPFWPISMALCPATLASVVCFGFIVDVVIIDSSGIIVDGTGSSTELTSKYKNR